ncbi:hypothetical protein PLICRDRAFT_35839 [Plicaturopsis crispa FD-325 SS-3]|nr:hypothetical protein PLICRDRAFT_35839 [Plicaturopsis crispa FD-325 SS-3]
MLSALIVGALLAGSSMATPFTSPFEPMDLFRRISSGCSTTGATSCHNTTVEKDSCCFEAPGGLLLQTQFWDTDPSTGPTDSWTIHGLWPDNCDGTYESSCDPSRAYTDISGLLTDAGESDLLSYMDTYWVNDPDDGSNEEFWEHEWAKHGTCYSTLETSCLPSGSAKGAEAVAFFKTVVKLFKTLPTYDWLSKAGITPSSSKKYATADILSALKSAGGVTPAIDCTSGALGSISWYYNLKGSVIDGDFVAIDTPEAGSCSGSVSYLPKSGSSSPTSTTTGTSTKTSTSTSSTSTSAPTGIPSKATITAKTSSGSTGGLLSAGTWSTQTLASYTLSGSADSLTLKSSKGACGVSSGKFACGSSVAASKFSAVTSGSSLLLAYDGSTKWSSDDTPSGSTVETVYTGSSHDNAYKLVIVSA